MWTVSVVPGAVWVAPDRPARNAKKPSCWPARVSWASALQLVSSGQVARGLLYRREGQRFLEELEARGVVVVDDGAESPLARPVRFDASQAIPERVYRRRRHSRPNGEGATRGAGELAAAATPESTSESASASEGRL